MGHIVQRFTFRLTRGWAVVLLVVGAVLATAFWIGPLHPLPAELQVLAYARDSIGGAAVAAPSLDSETDRLRFAIPLAVRNVGARSARPERLMLSVPAYYRVATRSGTLLGDVTPGVPLRRYVIDLEDAPVPPDGVVRALPGVDTIWVEPDLPSYYCVARTGPVPDFVPAPARNPNIISGLRIFYSVRTQSADERHAGLLAVHVDPHALDVASAPQPPSFPTTFRTPEVDEPELPGLRKVGSRTVHCGDPEQPLELRSVLMETSSRGRVFELHVLGEPRKRLYDLNRDSVVELETWDADGDGRFDARRDARFRVPEFLVPPPSRIPYALLPDTLPPDSVWLATFHDTGRGLHRFSQRRPVAAVADPVEETDSIGAATEELSPEFAGAADPIVGMPAITLADIASGRRPRVWLALFNDTAAGPFRFSSSAAAAAAVSRAAADSAKEAAARRRARRPAPEPLGTPIDYPRPPGRRH
jgi:hypothetical protein